MEITNITFTSVSDLTKLHVLDLIRKPENMHKKKVHADVEDMETPPRETNSYHRRLN